MELNKVWIGKAHSGLVSDQLLIEHDVADENQHWTPGPGISNFGQFLINKALESTEQAKWGLEHAEDGYWVRRVDEESRWLIYHIYVNLDDKNFTYWRLKYE